MSDEDSEPSIFYDVYSSDAYSPGSEVSCGTESVESEDSDWEAFVPKRLKTLLKINITLDSGESTTSKTNNSCILSYDQDSLNSS